MSTRSHRHFFWGGGGVYHAILRVKVQSGILTCSERKTMMLRLCNLGGFNVADVLLLELWK